MSREEFLRQLKESLKSSLGQDALNKQIDYYDNYISEEIKKGRSETDVINELGDPRLIAKTIKEVSSEDNSSIDYNTDDMKTERDNFNRRYSEKRSQGMPYYYSTSGIGCVIAALVVFIIVYAILSFFGRVAVGSVRLMFASPIAFIAIIGLLYYIFGRNR